MPHLASCETDAKQGDFETCSSEILKQELEIMTQQYN